LIDHICEKPISTEGSKNDEIEKVRQTSTLGEALEIPDSTVDVFIKDNKDIEHYIDITTVKLNKKGARSLRRKMLVWAALRFSQNPNAQVKTYLGLPYNPYNPKPYYRSFVVGNCHIDEVLVQDDFWGLCAGYDVFDELIAIFKEVGIEIEDDLADFIDGV
jgi:type II restriction enzyme